MTDEINSFIRTAIKENGQNKNIIIRTDKLQQYKKVSNCDIYCYLHNLENRKVIKIHVIADKGKLYNKLSRRLCECDKYTRYEIDILQPEFFNMPNIKDLNWAIKTHFDKTICKFIIEFNGLGKVKEVPVIKFYRGKETNIFKILKCLQDNNGTLCPINDICDKYLDTLREFFYRFSDNSAESKNIFQLIIEAPKGIGSICYHQTITPEDISYHKIKQICLQDAHKRADNNDYLQTT